MKKQLCSLFLAAIIVILSCLPAFGEETPYVVDEKPITVTYNADTIHFPDAQPIIQDGRTLVPLRSILERAQLDVNFDTKSKTVTAACDDFSISMPIDKNEATVTMNGKKELVSLEVPATIINDRTYVPIRFIAQALGTKVNWNPNYREVVIIDTAEWETDTCEKSAFLELLLSMPAEEILKKNDEDGTYNFLLTNKNVRLPFSFSEINSSESFGDFLKNLILADDMLYTNSVMVLDTYFSLYSIFYSDNFFTTEKQRSGTLLWRYKPDKDKLVHAIQEFFESHEPAIDSALIEETKTELSEKLNNLKNQSITFKTTEETVMVPENAYVIDEWLSFVLEEYIGLLFS